VLGQPDGSNTPILSALSSTNKLLNCVLDGFFAIRHLDCEIVFAGGQLTLHNYVSAFCEARRSLREALAECNDVVPLGIFLPLAFIVLPGSGRRDQEFGHWGAFSTVVWSRRSRGLIQ